MERKYKPGFNSELEKISIEDSLKGKYVRFEHMSGNSINIGKFVGIKENHYVLNPYLDSISGKMVLSRRERYIPCESIGSKNELSFKEVRAFQKSQNNQFGQAKKSTNSKPSQ